MSGSLYLETQIPHGLDLIGKLSQPALATANSDFTSKGELWARSRGEQSAATVAGPQHGEGDQGGMLTSLEEIAGEILGGDDWRGSRCHRSFWWDAREGALLTFGRSSRCVQRIDSIYKQNSNILPVNVRKLLCLHRNRPEMAPRNLVKIPTNRRPPNTPQPWTSQELLMPCQRACCPGTDCDAMEPHRVDSICLVGKLRSAPVMAARFERSNVLKCPPAKAVSRQALPVPLSGTHKREDLES
jgi:hypothetical protein